ncbi:MAG: hypothetical protein CO189_04680 [candidate division Zixibacteria bacterium CG_4_9_14_3_um_filter_46_8]|nr:MAG: hypothetical protein CO189_04680 [candidate division Zixibacteria bacterium CG_4_9_14_3_um_filter_46_8]
MICGTSGTFLFGGSNYRDTDWFTITTTDVGDLTWKAVAEFPLLIFIIDDGSGTCTDYTILGRASVAACDTATLTFNVPAGTYYLWIGPSVFSGADCPLDYVAFCDWVSAGPPPCADVLIGDIVLPYAYSGTNCGFVNDWSTTCLGSYDGGEDIIFSFNLLAQTDVIITMDPLGSTWTGIALDDACPLDPVTCIAMSTGSSGIRTIGPVTLAAGTYYIMVDTWPSPTCIPAFDLTITTPPPPMPGETCETAIDIPALPYYDAQSTCTFFDNCAITGSNNRDVIYKLVMTELKNLTVSLCGSAYDTKLAVFADNCCTGAGTEMLYNDDFCGLQSEVSGNFNPGIYYVVVDGYSTACGDYTLNITENLPCIVECPTGGIPEGEPVCGPDYVDNYNGGCNSTPNVFQTINNHDVICGTSGTFLFGGNSYRDTDWYELSVPADGNLSWSGVAEFPLLMFIIDSGSGDCVDYSILTYATAGVCDTLTLSYAVTAGTYWLWIGPSVFTGADCPLDYVAWADGPENPLPDITIGMTPDNPPIVVPLGGQFTYVGTLTNNTVGDLYTDVWIKITHLPSGNFLNWRHWLDVLVVAGMTQSYNIIQMVGTWPPLGEYTLSASCGDYPGVVIDETSFNFTVVAGSGPNADWASRGWGENNIIPTEFALNSSYPNPFNATTAITFELPIASNVSLEIYNLMGQKVATLAEGNKAAGYHSVTWDAANYSSGIYFYKLTAGEKVFTKRMTLIK